jgi:hypothetical protein
MRTYNQSIIYPPDVILKSKLFLTGGNLRGRYEITITFLTILLGAVTK